MQNGWSSVGSIISGLSADEDYMGNFADIVRTHVFD